MLYFQAESFNTKYGDEVIVTIKHVEFGPRGNTVTKRYEFPRQTYYECGVQCGESKLNNSKDDGINATGALEALHTPKKRNNISQQLVTSPPDTPQLPSHTVAQDVANISVTKQSPNPISVAGSSGTNSSQQKKNKRESQMGKSKNVLAPVKDLPGNRKPMKRKVKRLVYNLNKCAVCKNIFRKKDEDVPGNRWMGCDMCNKTWVHAKCVGIKVTKKTNLNKIPYTCDMCK